jgi:UDP-glucose 4-epimerase
MRWFIIGGAGFIGSHFVDALLQNPKTSKVTIYDNFTSGRQWHYEKHVADTRLNICVGNIENTKQLHDSMKQHDVVIHLASNPDISKAVSQPDIDFWQGTYLTNNVLEAVRTNGISKLLYASGSGVYGDIGLAEASESTTPLQPSSTYGASKLAGEALISSYCSMFGISACAFRFGNVIGARQTHGVGLDFLKNLYKNPVKLTILGDGNQSKSYIHVTDVVNAVLLANIKSKGRFNVYNVATDDYVTVTEIAKIAMECLNIPTNSVILNYTGGDRGWKGDVPVVRLNTNRIRNLGWKNTMLTREALKTSMMEMLPDIKIGRL